MLLQAAESLEGMPGINGQVLHFGRPGGWRSVTNFGPRPVPIPRGTVVVASGPLQDGLLPADTTAWIIPGKRSDLSEGGWRGLGRGLGGAAGEDEAAAGGGS
jgi:hypothetical protein